jgi:hypothetical protein
MPSRARSFGPPSRRWLIANLPGRTIARSVNRLRNLIAGESFKPLTFSLVDDVGEGHPDAIRRLDQEHADAMVHEE